MELIKNNNQETDGYGRGKRPEVGNLKERK